MDYVVWNIDPNIFTIPLPWGGDWPIRWYSLLFGTGILLGYLRMRQLYLSEGRTEDQLNRGFTYFFFGTIIGARLGHCLFYEADYYLSRPWEIFIPPYEGLASHGGVIGITIAMILYIRKEPNISFLWLSDRLALGIPIGVPWIRLGNFMNSEILGKSTTAPWAIIFQRVDEVPRHPSQLYEAFSYFAIAAVLNFVYANYKEKLGRGALIGWMFILIFSARFLIEFTKENQADFVRDLPLNMGQLLSIPMVAFGFALWAYSFKQPKLTEDGA